VDVAGRVVSTTSWVPHAAGQQTLSLDSIRYVRPGVYFVSLEHRGRSLARRAVVVR
jgi:hypothetical protein